MLTNVGTEGACEKECASFWLRLLFMRFYLDEVRRLPASCCTMSQLPLIDVTLFQCTLWLMPGSTCGSGTTGATCTPGGTRPSTPIKTAPTGTSGTTNCHRISGANCKILGDIGVIRVGKERRRDDCHVCQSVASRGATGPWSPGLGAVRSEDIEVRKGR